MRQVGKARGLSKVRQVEKARGLSKVRQVGKARGLSKVRQVGKGAEEGGSTGPRPKPQNLSAGSEFTLLLPRNRASFSGMLVWKIKNLN